MIGDKNTDKCEMLSKGIDLAKMGFKLEEKNIYESLISPFADDQDKPHPFKSMIPDSFYAPEFVVDKMDKSKIPEDTLIYIFYNIMDNKMQLMATELLIAKKIYFLKNQRIWLKETGEGSYNYFNIQTWKFTQYKGQVRPEDFVTLKQFQDSIQK